MNDYTDRIFRAAMAAMIVAFITAGFGLSFWMKVIKVVSQ